MGLKDFQQANKIQPRKPSWLKIKNGETKRLAILAEPSEFKIVVEHTSPENWRKRAVCTGEECYACEQRTYGWNQSIRVYIPVLLNNRPYVIAQGVGANSVLHSLVQHKRNRGIIKDVIFEVSRSGEGKRSAYRAEPTKELSPLTKVKVDINQLINNIEYSKQKTYYKE